MSKRKRKKQIWIMYDGRAEFQDTDDCSIYVTADSLQEAKSYLTDFPDGVIFRYDLIDNKATNETRIYIIHKQGD